MTACAVVILLGIDMRTPPPRTASIPRGLGMDGEDRHYVMNRLTAPASARTALPVVDVAQLGEAERNTLVQSAVAIRRGRAGMPE